MDIGVARNSETLIAGRAITGLGGAGVIGGVYIIVAFVVPPPKQAAYLGLVGAVFSIASVAGPLLGGVLTDRLSWRWWFVNVFPKKLLLLTHSSHTASISISQSAERH